MLAESLLSPHLPTAQPDDTIRQVLEHMQRFNLLHLPVVKDRNYLGTVARMYLDQIDNKEDSLAQHLPQLPLLKENVHAKQHFFDVIDLMNSLRMTAVPVLDDDQKYLGAVSAAEVLTALQNLSASDEPGFIVVLSMQKLDYSLTEIAGIVESNNARIVSLYMSPGDDSRSIYVNLKINGEVSGPVVLSFQRYGYDIAYVFSNAQEASDTQDRYDALMHYLNI